MNDAGVAPVGRQPQGPPNGWEHTQHRYCGALYPQPKPVPIYTACLVNRGTCVNNLPRVAPIAAEQPGIELATSRSRIRRPTAIHHQATHLALTYIITPDDFHPPVIQALLHWPLFAAVFFSCRPRPSPALTCVHSPGPQSWLYQSRQMPILSGAFYDSTSDRRVQCILAMRMHSQNAQGSGSGA